MTRQLCWLDTNDLSFPETGNALTNPNGLLAVGGDLSTPRLLEAYRQGIFPWFSEGQPILWWTPNPRMVLFPEQLNINRSLRKLSKKHPFKITVDQAFNDVIHLCAQPRMVDGVLETCTWITQEIENAYTKLHLSGVAHSVEAWQDKELVGGLYGISIGRVFFGESMFSLVSGASKLAFASLAKQLEIWKYHLIDCQMHSQHLASFGASEIPRHQFEELLRIHTAISPMNNAPYCQHTPFMWQKNWNLPEYGFD